MSEVDFVCMALLLLLGIPIVYCDLRHRVIPNILTYAGMLAGLAVLVVFRRPEFINYSLAFILGFGVFYILYMFGWIGGGDVKLMGMVGILMGFPFLVNALVYIALAGGLVGLAEIAVRAWRRQSLRGARIPYGTAIIAGCYYTAFQMLLMETSGRY